MFEVNYIRIYLFTYMWVVICVQEFKIRWPLLVCHHQVRSFTTGPPWVIQRCSVTIWIISPAFFNTRDHCNVTRYNRHTLYLTFLFAIGGEPCQLSGLSIKSPIIIPSVDESPPRVGFARSTYNKTDVQSMSNVWSAWATKLPRRPLDCSSLRYSKHAGKIKQYLLMNGPISKALNWTNSSCSLHTCSWKLSLSIKNICRCHLFFNSCQ